MNLLFVCSGNRLRSPTAEEVFNTYEGVEAIGAGTNNTAITQVSGDLIEWADMIIVMEQVHKKKLFKKFNSLLQEKRIVVLGIPDNYTYMQRELVDLLVRRVEMYLER